MSAFDLDAAVSSASGEAQPPALSPFGPAAMERAAKDQFIAALRDYRSAVRQAHEDGSADAHELVRNCLRRLDRVRRKKVGSSRALSDVWCQRMESEVDAVAAKAVPVA